MENRNLKKEIEEDLKFETEIFVKSLSHTRGSRINTDSIRQLTVPGLNSKIFHISNVFSSKNELVIEPFEKKNTNNIIKTLVESDFGYRFERNFEEKIFFSLIPLNQEIKKRIVLVCKQKLEEAKISLRKIRQKFLSLIKSSKKSIDEQKKIKKEIEEITKRFELNFTKMYEEKVKEVMEF